MENAEGRLEKLRALDNKATRLYKAFLEACAASDLGSAREFYQRHDRGGEIPDEVEKAYVRFRDALHEYYLFRDGPKGFLGGRGL